MICTTIQNKNLEQILDALEGSEMAEIRLDRCDLSLREIEECFTSDVPLVATCRIADLIASEPSLQDAGLTPQSKEIKAAQIAEKRLCKAIEAGARYVDVEIEAPKQMSKRVRNVAHESGTVFIRSFHDFEGTDSLEALKAVVEKCCYHGADMVKVVTTACCQEDVDKVLSLYDWCRATTVSENEKIASLAEGGLIAFCMGDAGRQSRLDCLKAGAPYTYAAVSEEEAAAPGQWTASEMAAALYDGFRFVGTCNSFGGKLHQVPTNIEVPAAVSGEKCIRCIQESDNIVPNPEVPCSKSFAQRAIIAAALASGTSHLRGYTPCGDNEAAIRVAENLGAKVERNGGELIITGIAASLGSLDTLPAGANSGVTPLQEGSGHLTGTDMCWEKSSLSEDMVPGVQTLHVGESGLLTRMMIPVMAQLCPDTVLFTGEKTLLGRPLTGACEIMEALGANVTSVDHPVAVTPSSVTHCHSAAGAPSPVAQSQSRILASSVTNSSETIASDPLPVTLGEAVSQCPSVVTSSEAEGRDERSSAPIRVPLTVKGPLTATRAEISGKHGSQIISGLLMALPFSQKNTSLIVREPKSIPYMFITVEVLKKFGIKIGNDMLGGRDFIESGGDWSLCTEIVFKVKGGQRFKAADIDLEGDWSAAANFLVAGAIFGKVEVEGLDTTSLQADLSIMDILMDAGASLSLLDGDKGSITVQRAPLKAFAVDASNCPDLFPIISVLAAFCQGTSRIAGVGRLANKESDRAKAIVEMLTQMGVKSYVEGDELLVEGHSLAQRLLAHKGVKAYVGGDGLTEEGHGFAHKVSGVASHTVEASLDETSGIYAASASLPGLLKGGEYTSHHDHRMVMALKVASLGADSPIVIDDETCVEKSFPDFLEMFRRLD